MEWRKKGIGASDATIIMGLSPWQSRKQLMKKKSDDLRELQKKRKGKSDKLEPDNGAMARGRRLEPIAREIYTDLTGIKSEPVCAIHDDIDWMRASFDGLSEDGQIVLEIKCVNKLDHQCAIEGMVPPKYWPQVQHQLIIHGGPVLHYFSYSDNPQFSEPWQKTALVEVKPDRPYQERLMTEESLFWKELQQKLLSPHWLEKD